jgi:hypothetical protein
METSTRRKIVQMCLACGAAAAAHHVPAQLPARTPTQGCRWSASSDARISVVGADLGGSTGDAQLDAALGRALVRLSTLFGERAGFGFVDEGNRKNAWADDVTRVTGTRGTVLFGKNMFKDLMERFDDGGIAVITVAAHEFGHISQFNRGIFRALNENQPTVKRSELHADLLAGYFLGTRKNQNPDLRIRTGGVALFEIGDYEFNSQDHHGTPDERVEAAEYGYKFAMDGTSFDAAVKDGMQWIMSRRWSS